MGNDLVQLRASPPGLRQRCRRGRENETKIAGHVSRLMSHFWTANEDPRLRAAQAQDWLEDLAEFHEALVGEACRDWRQSETRRPTIADIRKLCSDKADPWHKPEPPPPPETEEEIAARIAQRQQIGEKFGQLAKKLRGEIPW